MRDLLMKMTSWGYINDREALHGKWSMRQRLYNICNDWSNDQGWNGKSILKNLNYTALIHLNTFTYFSFWSTHGQLSWPKERELTPQINSFFLSFWEILHPREKKTYPIKSLLSDILFNKRCIAYLFFYILFCFF